MKKLPWFIFTFLFLLLVSIAAWIALERIKEESLKTIKNSLQTVTKTTHEALNIWIRNRQSNLIEIANDETLILLAQQLLKGNESTSTRVEVSDLPNSALEKSRAFMKNKMNAQQDIGFFIIAPDKKNIASMRDSNLHETNLIFKKRPKVFNRMLKGETLFVSPINSDVPIEMKNGSFSKNLPSIFIGTPIYDPLQGIIALLTLRIDPSYDFSRVTQLGRIGVSGETYAFDDNAILITNSRFEEQLQEIGLLTESHESSMLSIRVADPGGNMLNGYKPKMPRNLLPLTVMSKSAMKGENNFNITGYRDYRGVLVFGHWIWDDSLGFGLATEIDVDEALISYYKTRNILILAVFSIAFVSLGGFYIWIIIEKQANTELKQAFAKLEKKVDERTKELQALSYQDGLTEIANRRKFDRELEQEWHRAMRHQESLSLILIDIDFFKFYNDNYGHLQGDECLKQVSKILSQTSQRITDIVARYGGEEFVVLLPQTNLEQAKALAEKFRQRIIEGNIEHKFSNIVKTKLITISLGVSSMTPLLDTSSELLIKEADIRLYQAKKNGRNRVE